MRLKLIQPDIAFLVQMANEQKDLQSPHLTIIDLMVWTGCAAVYLAVAEHPKPMFSRQENYLYSIQISQVVVNSLLFGASFMAFIALVRHRARLAMEPGSWLVVSQTIGAASWLVVYLLPAQPGVSIILIGVTLALAGLDSIIAWEMRGVPGWRVFFWLRLAASILTKTVSLFVLANAVSSTPSWVGASSLLSAIVLMGLVVRAARIDNSIGIRRSWVHWTGCLVFLAGTAFDWIALMVSYAMFASR